MTTPYEDAAVNTLGAVAHWPLNELGGTTATDATSNNYDATYEGGPSLGMNPIVNDRAGYAMVGDGSDDYIQAPYDADDLSFEHDDDWSIAGWFRLDEDPSSWESFSEWACVYSIWGGGGVSDQQLLIRIDSTSEISLNVAGAGTDTDISSYIDGGWHFYVVRNNGTDNADLLIDGDLISSVTPGTFVEDGRALDIGHRDQADMYWPGAIAQVSAFDYELTNANITALMDAAEGDFATQVTHGWQEELNGTSGLPSWGEPEGTGTGGAASVLGDSGLSTVNGGGLIDVATYAQANAGGDWQHHHRFIAHITEGQRSPDKWLIRAKGQPETNAGTPGYGTLKLYVGNRTTEGWVELDSVTSPEAGTTYTLSSEIDASFIDYVSDDGDMDLLVVLEGTEPGNGAASAGVKAGAASVTLPSNAGPFASSWGWQGSGLGMGIN